MARSRKGRWNPFVFYRVPVTIVVTVLYLALLIPLLVVQHTLPAVPDTNPHGLDLDEAWQDLQRLTNGYHPYNSRKNDDVRRWLLTRIDEIITAAAAAANGQSSDRKEALRTFVFDDNQSNLTIVDSNLGVYFEGTNVIVYIRGQDDDKREWWNEPGLSPSGRGGVLVNAHYDSVSTGYGATDDGVGVVSCLQLIKYFTTPGHEPLRGLVVMFNNGEEDYLNGARVYSQHPISKLPHTFLNLEGAGAGGRAALFRTSDTQVARFYKRSPHPYASVFSDAAFKLNVIRSQTDYVVLEGDLGLRGLDVAFTEPRARYHTNQDDTKHTNKQALWHMLSAAVATTEGLVTDSSHDFEGRPRSPGKIPSGTGSGAVWFDLFGSLFVIFEIHTLFALSVTLLIVGPLTLLITSTILANQDRMYLFAISAPADDGFGSASLRGWRGFFRFPLIFGTTTACVVGLAFLLTKVNPMIVHSSEYAVWAMMMSAWFFIAWFLSRIANFTRPSALHRIYVLTWMFTLAWVLLVISTVYENRDDIASGYVVIFYAFGTFMATWISYLELFLLPKKSEFANKFSRPSSSRRTSLGGSRLLTPRGEFPGQHAEDEEPTESTSLLRGQRTSFANYTRSMEDEGGDADLLSTAVGTDVSEARDANVYGYEQRWSASMPKWTWILQLLFIAPVVIVLVGHLGLLITAGIHQTMQDGSSILLPYLMIAVLTTLLLMPTLPFIHRYTYHIPTFLFLVFVGTLIYNLIAFPFSEGNRLKLFFLQEVNLDNGVNHVSLTGVSPFVDDAATYLPSTYGQNISCVPKADRTQCSWKSNLLPRVISNLTPGKGEPPLKEWINYETSRLEPGRQNTNRAQIKLRGKNTRGCLVHFDKPIVDFSVVGSATDSRFPSRPSSEDGTESGVREIRLWSRTWDNQWLVDVEWVPEISLHGNDTKKDVLSGTVTCLWSDANTQGAIPALDEALQYSPGWVAITKLDPGLVRGSRAFKV